VRRREKWSNTYGRCFIVFFLGILYAWRETVLEEGNEYTEPTTGPYLRWDIPAKVMKTPLINTIDDGTKHTMCGVFVARK
jgi:hypothetical protein